VSVGSEDTCARRSLPIVAVISNDSGWGMVLEPRQRYDKMVEALGGYGEYVDKIEDIKPALTRAFASGLPALFNVEVDPQPASIATVWLHDTMK